MSRPTDKPTTSRKSRRPIVAPRVVSIEPVAISAGDRARMIAERAYYLAAERGFAAGAELDDWLTAEREIDQRIAN